MADFNKAIPIILAHEGGWVDDPADPGGETNMGISKRSYPKENIRGMTRERAAQIYRKDFWDKLKCDDLPAGLDLVAFDAGVNSGPARGAKWLQQAVGRRGQARCMWCDAKARLRWCVVARCAG